MSEESWVQDLPPSTKTNAMGAKYELEDLSKKVNNPLKDEKYGVRQNTKTFLTGIERCTSSDVAKSKSYLNNINSALNTASVIRASIDSKRNKRFQSADYTQGRNTKNS